MLGTLYYQIDIQTAEKASQKLARESLGVTVSLKIDSENMRSKMSNESSNEDKKVRMKNTPINISDVKKLAEIKHVKSYNLISTTYVNADSFEPIVSEESENNIKVGISGVVGNKVSNVMATNLLSNQIEISSSTNKGITGMDSKMRDKAGMREESSVKTIDSMDVEITIIVFGKMTVVTISIAIVSILLPSISIIRLNPKNILSKHQ
ncbi:hypothetical protein [Clostridium sp. ATCC 25772]|uniref:hypothetical protein n=1 Tax=Clostridium sp. ATCC 25772 TaxID=1676991 RepID=UPI0007823643|nr:hypothetical protein [Clostridium sp. ATCC 25772]